MAEYDNLLLSNESNMNFSRWLLNADIDGPTLAFSMALLLFITLPPNLFIVLYSLYHRKRVFQTSSLIFLLNVALNDLLLTVLYMPFVIVASGAGEWIFGSTDGVRSAFCQIHGFIFNCIIGESIYAMTVVSVDRWLFIVKSRHYHKVMNYRVAMVITAVTWILAILAGTTPLFGFGEYDWSSTSAGCGPIFTGNEKYASIGSIIVILNGSVIIITTIWTTLVTQSFLKKNLIRHMENLNTENLKVQREIYTKRIKHVISIFGAFLIIQILSWLPVLLITIIRLTVSLPEQYINIVTYTFVFLFIRPASNPYTQFWFRKDLSESLHGISRRITKSFMPHYFQRKSGSDTMKA